MTLTTGTTRQHPPRRVDFGYRAVTFRGAGLGLRWRVRTLVVCAVLVGLTLAVTAWALTLGSFPLTAAEVWAALVDDPAAGFARTVVVDWRLPRALAAAIFGAALGVSGAVFQSLTRNPLASPDVIGFSTGSYTGALVVMTLLGGGYLQVAAGALIGGLLTAAVVSLLAWGHGVHGFRLIIVGIAVGSVLGSVNTWLLLTADLEVATSASVWGVGSLNGAGWDQVALGGAGIAGLLALLAGFAPALRQLELGDDAAKATGTRTGPVRLAVVLIGVALTAAVTAAAGPIAFVALAAPQIARRLTRASNIALVPSALVGALLLAGADLAAQHLLSLTLPVGVVTVTIGGGYLVWLIVHEVRRRA